MKNKFMISGISGFLFILLIILIRTVDVDMIGPEGTGIGLSHINKAVHDLFGVNFLWYDITDWLGVAAIGVAFIFAVMGLLQLIKRRSLLKVDKAILALGCLYIAMIGLYLLFEFAIVNYRPIIMPGCEHPEASFPSSHTMLVCVIMGSAMMLMKKYVKRCKVQFVLQIICALIITVTVVGRLISGVHWLTDIICGILISTMLLTMYFGIMEKLKD